MILNTSIGADPEVFFERDGEIISVEGLLGGTKKVPKAISKEGHSIQEDNVMAEFNVPPSYTKEDFVYNIEFVKDYLEVAAGLHGAKLNFSASANLDRKYLRTKQAKTFGCEPDWNLYTEEHNVSPSKRTTLRTCGGHIHIGYDDPNQDYSTAIVRAMDATIGLKSLFIDKDDQRRQMYGKAGSFRFKSFGVEYRTLSNFWIQNTDLIKWAFEETHNAIQLINDGFIPELMRYSRDIEHAINNNNRDLAKQLLEQIEKIKIKETV
jgi:hypothetical protein